MVWPLTLWLPISSALTWIKLSRRLYWGRLVVVALVDVLVEGSEGVVVTLLQMTQAKEKPPAS